MMRIPAILALVGALAFGGLLDSAPAQAAQSDDRETVSTPEDPNWKAAKRLVAAQDYDGAMPLLQKVVAADPKNADAFNYLGYVNSRKGETEAALRYYQQALAIKPSHRGANEYLGELYLKLGDLPAAEARLKVLDSACFFGCSEYTQLKKAIADYKATGKFAIQKDG